MVDPFLILTPILLLAIVSLLGFVGCQLVFPLDSPPAVAHVATTVKRGSPGTDTVTSDAINLEGGELIVATVQWGSAAVQQAPPTLTGAEFLAVLGGGPFIWNAMKVQTFIGFNPEHSTAVVVQAKLPGDSNVVWNLCISAYKNADVDTPIASPQQNGFIFVGTNPQLPGISVNAGDLVYAICFAADSNGAFPGNNSIAAGPGFVAEFPAINNPLVENGGTGNPVVAQATITTQGPNPMAFMFGLGIKSASS